MPLIHVADVGNDAERSQGTDAADPQQDFLDHAHLFVAEIELGRDQTVFRTVLFQVGIQQIERHPSNLDPPDMHLELAEAELQLKRQWLAIFVAFQDQRQVVEIVLGVELLLPTLVIQVLAEISLAV